MNRVKIKFIERAKERLTRKEADLSWRRRQVGDPMHYARILHADTHPNVRGPRQRRRKRTQAVGTLREYLEGMLRRRLHRPKDALDELERHFFLEEVAH